MCVGIILSLIFSQLAVEQDKAVCSHHTALLDTYVICCVLELRRELDVTLGASLSMCLPTQMTSFWLHPHGEGCTIYYRMHFGE